MRLKVTAIIEPMPHTHAVEYLSVFKQANNLICCNENMFALLA